MSRRLAETNAGLCNLESGAEMTFGASVDSRCAHPAFSVLERAAKVFEGAPFPSLAALDDCLSAGAVRNASGLPLRAIDGDLQNDTAVRYELRILEQGKLAVRSDSWHDVFNVLVWRTFPRAKAALNLRHCAELIREPREAIRRGRVRDSLTLLDESGIIVVASDGSLLEAIRAFRWKEVFWTRRAELLCNLRVYVFGHALYEKLISPYIGLTGHAVLLEVERHLIAAPLTAQLGVLDSMLATVIGDPLRLESPRDLQPMPVLGMPCWHSQTVHESFYDNVSYFRTQRRERKPRAISAARGG